jgi:two-component system response regulator NreC
MPPRANLRILVVEDQTILRQLLCQHLQGTYPGCEVTEFSTLAQCRGVSASCPRLDLAIVDLDLPDGNAMDWVQEWLKNEDNKAIILSSINEDYVLFRALQSNVQGYVHKNDATEMLHTAIGVVLAGGVLFSPTVQEMRTRMQADPAFFNKILSEREQEVLELLGKGLPVSEVAALLGLREVTVGDHRKHIMNKLGLHSQGDIMVYAREKGFVRR